jgi:predicted phosphoadenosine phosphosulfate sulfurtransferase
MPIKNYLDINVLEASKQRISDIFDNFNRYYISFSGGKDSTIITHLIMNEAKRRNKKVGLLIVDLEAQYNLTIRHIRNIIRLYRDNIDLHWICPELRLRNAVSDFEPNWVCWDKNKKGTWVRTKPIEASNLNQYDFYIPKMEFEEFILLFGEWYAKNEKTAGFIGIRTDESLNRYMTITSNNKNLMHNNWQYTTKISDYCYNVYPIYDWKTKDVWIYQLKNKNLSYNKIYDLMTKAGVKLKHQRLCQPFGDEQKKGLWLYHILEFNTWVKLLNRVNGINSEYLYNMDMVKPKKYTWESYTNYLLKSLPKKIQKHYMYRFKKFIDNWNNRGYSLIPDEAPSELEAKNLVPSWRLMSKCIMKNDYWCKGLGQSQPKSEAYEKYKAIKTKRRLSDELKQKEKRLGLFN